MLDTWFSSWLWPFSTMGWPEQTPTLRRFYPTDTLVTAADIIFFWVARMVMAGYEFMGECPFGDVYLNSIVRDDKGRKMSKSLGNSPDPMDVIDKYGADALRFTIVSLAPLGQDVRYGVEKTEFGRNFANKIWNAARFALMNLGGDAVAPVGGSRRRRPARPTGSAGSCRACRRSSKRPDGLVDLSLQRCGDDALSLHLGRLLRLVSGARQVDFLRRGRGGEGPRAPHSGDGARPDDAPAAPVHAVHHRGDLAGAADAATGRVDHDRSVSDRASAWRDAEAEAIGSQLIETVTAIRNIRSELGIARHAGDRARRDRRASRQRRRAGRVHQGAGARRVCRAARGPTAACQRTVRRRRRPGRAVRSACAASSTRPRCASDSSAT